MPGTGKSTLARHLATEIGAVLLRIDEIEAAMRRNGLTSEQTGLAAYSVAHAIAVSQLDHGLTVIADAVNPVEAARRGWRNLAAEHAARHVVIEIVCPDLGVHRDRATTRAVDVEGWVYPTWAEIEARAPSTSHASTSGWSSTPPRRSPPARNRSRHTAVSLLPHSD